MSRIDTTNLLPLDTWRAAMGFNPWHFWQAANTTVPVTSSCDPLVYEHGYQATDAASREEIREAIINAEAMLIGEVGYSPLARYTEWVLPWPRNVDASYIRYAPIDATWRWISVTPPEGEIQELGLESRTLLCTATTTGNLVTGLITYSDADGDGIQETFTITFTTTVTDADLIAVYVAAADRLDSAPVSERWRINPVTASISAGTLTVTGRRWLLVRPILYEGFTQATIDPATAGSFVTSLEVYTRETSQSGTTTDTSEAVLIWETRPCPAWWCCGGTPTYTPANSAFDPGAVAQAVARGQVRDRGAGIVTVAGAFYNTTSGVWGTTPFDTGTEPDRVRVRALAGVPPEGQQMARKWATIVARLAAAELARPVCGCDNANREVYRWQFDLARSAGANDEQYQISAQQLDNPFGTRRGHVYAWQQVVSERRLRGFLT